MVRVSYLKQPLTNIVGADLKSGTLWIAEVTLALGICLVVFSYTTLSSLQSPFYERYGISQLKMLLSIPILFGVLKIIFGSMMLHAAIRSVPCLLLPWIIYSSILTVIVGLITIVAAFWTSLQFPLYSLWIPIIFFGIVNCAVMKYFIIGVYSFYRQLKMSSEDSRPLEPIFTD